MSYDQCSTQYKEKGFQSNNYAHKFQGIKFNFCIMELKTHLQSRWDTKISRQMNTTDSQRQGLINKDTGNANLRSLWETGMRYVNVCMCDGGGRAKRSLQCKNDSPPRSIDDLTIPRGMNKRTFVQVVDWRDLWDS